MSGRIFTQEILAYLRKVAPGLSNEKIAKLINSRFNLQLTTQQIKTAKANYKISSGLTGYWPKGHIPHNKGCKGIHYSPSTEFKPGNKPQTYLPVGTEVVDNYGYRKLKVGDPNKWRFVHRLEWEKHNGPIPKGHAVIFLDKNKLNCDLKNLACVSQAELVRLNQNGLISQDPQITEAGILTAKIKTKAFKLQRKMEEKHARRPKNARRERHCRKVPADPG